MKEADVVLDAQEVSTSDKRQAESDQARDQARHRKSNGAFVEIAHLSRSLIENSTLRGRRFIDT